MKGGVRSRGQRFPPLDREDGKDSIGGKRERNREELGIWRNIGLGKKKIKEGKGKKQKEKERREFRRHIMRGSRKTATWQTVSFY